MAASDAIDDPNLFARLSAFAGRAEPLGVRVERVADSVAAACFVAAIAGEIGASTILISDELGAASPGLVTALDATGCGWRPPGSPESTRDALLALSLAQLAIAETGSLLLAEATLDERAIGMLSAAHLIVCPTAALVDSLDAAAPVLRAVATRPGGGYATLVTGPSRTADIERVLTVGVQGPARVVALFIDALG